MTERAECNEQHPGMKHIHHCWRGDGHYDDHLCECGFDWPPGALRSIAEAQAAAGMGEKP